MSDPSRRTGGVARLRADPARLHSMVIWCCGPRGRWRDARLGGRARRDPGGQGLLAPRSLAKTRRPRRLRGGTPAHAPFARTVTILRRPTARRSHARVAAWLD